ncbi:MAG: hypothetical protein A3H63_00570 [Candidatus Harrisonbacteria bacterium RIFCSPLOWO2_02_FULL_45_10c]|uniref:DUF2079 domain-containing protein n=1 Tax=Candidatus Harrisonbacteria bacterium RIFCSPLOWO2_02_FULL_45_10c TaxID=1798410 RepID=A0A1G1ZU26_9BACT|nr:MAG: hypothetical protein A3H63_00570 [Candidatus Harrisonbacteria bacterium RIFCSPLOWO2_02_FULL_45_10c]
MNIEAKEKRIVWGLIFAFLIFFGIFTALRQYNFQTQAWDMGIFTQTFWNTVQGRFMQNTLEELPNHFGIHWSPILLLLVPGYALFPSPYFLLFIQTLAVALGAWPLYLLSKRILGPEWKEYRVLKNAPIIITAGYLLYAPLHWLTIYDFHEITFLVPLLIAGFYFMEIRRWGWASLFLLLAAATKEDAVIAVLFMGIYLLLKRRVPETAQNSSMPAWLTKERMFGIAVIIFSLLYFIFAIKIVMPAFGGGLLRLDRYSHFGNTFPEIITTIITQPLFDLKTIFTAEKIRYAVWLLLPVSFLPFFSWRTLILLIPGLAENLLTNFPAQFSGFYQYDATLIAGIFIGATLGLKNIVDKKWMAKKIALAALIAAIFIGYIMRSPVNPVFFPTNLFKTNPQWDALRAVLRSIPSSASVSANTNLVPHLANREHIYTLDQEPFPADIIIADQTDSFGFSDTQSFENYLMNYLNSGLYTFQTIENRYVIIIKK